MLKMKFFEKNDIYWRNKLLMKKGPDNSRDPGKPVLGKLGRPWVLRITGVDQNGPNLTFDTINVRKLLNETQRYEQDQ